MNYNGVLCCTNFFQDVKAVTIDNLDWGGAIKDKGETA